MAKNYCASIIWAINNFSHFWQKCDEAIISPQFFIYLPEETKWNLLLLPRGTSNERERDLISFFLYRGQDCSGIEQVEVEYSLEVLATDGSILGSATRKDAFTKDTRSKGFERYLYLKAIITTEVMKYLPQNMLTLRCRMIRFEGKTVEIQKIYVRTSINVQKRCFLWPIDSFSKLKHNQKQSFVIQSLSKEVIIQINLFLSSEQYNQQNIYWNICSSDQCVKFASVKTSIVDSQKQKVYPGEYDCWFDNEKCTKVFLLNITREQLMDNKSVYLPNDTLTLSFEVTISAGFAFEGVEKVVCDYTSCLDQNVISENWWKSTAQEKISVGPCALLADLTSLLKDESSSDMKLKTTKNIFPVHTSILSARSPVFKAMFSSEMKEKVNGCVDVSDLDDETVRRFLLYLYTDKLEDLKWEDALQLYRTADKYAVISLKEKCSKLLKSNVILENASEILVLSDLHQDKDLKLWVQSFILKNARIIFKSEEWKLLAETNSKLVIETMLRNWTE